MLADVVCERDTGEKLAIVAAFVSWLSWDAASSSRLELVVFDIRSNQGVSCSGISKSYTFRVAGGPTNAAIEHERQPGLRLRTNAQEVSENVYLHFTTTCKTDVALVNKNTMIYKK